MSLKTIKEPDQFCEREQPEHTALVREHYKCIGETLNIAEAGSWRAGVPLLFPTLTGHKLASQYQSPLHEFIQYSLVTINTSTLELYCDDLESSSPDDDISASLFIRRLSVIERWGACVVLAPLVALLTCLLAMSLGVRLITSLLAALACATLCFVVLSTMSLELQRRDSAAVGRGCRRRRDPRPRGGGVRSAAADRR